jgi:hypothetical protein
MTTVRRVHVDRVTGLERAPRGADLFMEVERKDDGFEYVVMANAVSDDDSMSPVPPHGLGWECHDTTSDKWWIWRRRVRA